MTTATLGLQDGVPRTNVQRFLEIRPFMLCLESSAFAVYTERSTRGDCGKVGLKGNGMCSLNKTGSVFESWLGK